MAKAKATRFYTDFDEVGLTPSQLKRASKAKQLEYMTHWFGTYFEDPAHQTPRVDGDFMYLWGGPYDASESFYRAFANIASEEQIEAAVNLVESDGVIDWAPSNQHPDMEDRYDPDEFDLEPAPKLYYARFDPVGVTAEELARKTRKEQVEYLTSWFRALFEDPATSGATLYEDGEFIFEWGGPYNAFHELGAEFSEFVSEAAIKQAVKSVEPTRPIEWAPSDRHPDKQVVFASKPTFESRLATIRHKLELGVQPLYGSQSEREQREAIQAQLRELDASLDMVRPLPGQSGHNSAAILFEGIDKVKRESFEASQELSKTNPDPSFLARAAAKIRGFFVWATKKVGEKTAEKAIENAIPKDMLQAALDKALEVAEALLDFLINIM